MNSRTFTTPERGNGDDALVSVDNLVIEFGVGRQSKKRRLGGVKAVNGVTLAIRPGEVLGLIGETGSGKSTVGRAILGIHKPTDGEINFGSLMVSKLSRRGLRELRRRVQIVFQDPYSSLDPRMRIGATIKEPLISYRIGNAKERETRTAQLLMDVGLPARVANSFPHQLSGGQRQRVAIARALALEPELIVADEVVSALDVSVQAQVMELLQKLKSESALAYLFISHDVAVVASISDRIAVMYLGKVVEEIPTADLLLDPCHPYTVGLMSAVGVPDPEIERLRKRIILEGDPPNPMSPPSGCKFHPRCWLRLTLPDGSRCEKEEPDLIEIGSGHRVACHFVEAVRASEERKASLAGLGDDGPQEHADELAK